MNILKCIRPKGRKHKASDTVRVVKRRRQHYARITMTHLLRGAFGCGTGVCESYSRQALGAPLRHSVSYSLHQNAGDRIDVGSAVTYGEPHVHEKKRCVCRISSLPVRKLRSVYDHPSVAAQTTTDCPLIESGTHGLYRFFLTWRSLYRPKDCANCGS